MKILIFDSGILINFSMNGFLYLIEELKKEFDGKFIITNQVKYEIIDRPIKVPRFELGALSIQNLLDEKVIELPSSLNVPESEISKRAKSLMNSANHIIEAKGKWVEIVSEAEMSCLALSQILTEKKIENLIAIDERTTRILSEKPENLEEIISKKIHQKISVNPKNVKEFENFKFIRSSELAYVSYKKGLVHLKGRKALEAVLYATKYKGSSISFDEINSLKKLT